MAVRRVISTCNARVPRRHTDAAMSPCRGVNSHVQQATQVVERPTEKRLQNTALTKYSRLVLPSAREAGLLL
jgi:hypothetical protein